MKNSFVKLPDFENRVILLRSLVGSHNYNLNTPESDKDYKFFVAPTFEDLYFGKMFSSANQSESFDYDCHDIRQLGNLLWKSNLNFIEVLFSREFVSSHQLSFLVARADEFAQMNMPAFFNATLGMSLQKMSELHKGTAKTKSIVEQLGYDSKQALHAVRCILILERIRNGMPFENAIWFESGSKDHTFLMRIKNGLLPESDIHSFVNKFMESRKDSVKRFFYTFKPNESLKAELDNTIMEIVRSRL